MASLIFFGVDLYQVNWYMIIYVIISIGAVAGGTNQLFPMGTSTAVIFAVGAVLVFLFYGYRWFGNQSGTLSKWPPTINSCPDYLTYVQSLSDKKPGCVDLLGVSSKSGMLGKTTVSNIPNLASNTSTFVFPFTSSDILNATDPATVQAICLQCNKMGVTWEGVFDGDTCVGVATSAAAKAAASKCKS
jgi:hypothetical protein